MWLRDEIPRTRKLQAANNPVIGSASLATPQTAHRKFPFWGLASVRWEPASASEIPDSCLSRSSRVATACIKQDCKGTIVLANGFSWRNFLAGRIEKGHDTGDSGKDIEISFKVVFD